MESDTFFATAVPGLGINVDDDDELPITPVFPLSSPKRAVVSIGDFDPAEVKLPITINIVAVRETLFADAPFISKNNKAFWRRMVDSKQFSLILAASYNFLAGCLTDSGAVLLDKLNSIQQRYTHKLRHTLCYITHVYYYRIIPFPNIRLLISPSYPPPALPTIVSPLFHHLSQSISRNDLFFLDRHFLFFQTVGS